MSTATKRDLQPIAALLAKLDICMLATRAEDGGLHGRPMSNNGEVEWDGDSWFFARVRQPQGHRDRGRSAGRARLHRHPRTRRG